MLRRLVVMMPKWHAESRWFQTLTDVWLKDKWDRQSATTWLTVDADKHLDMDVSWSSVSEL